VVFKLPAPISDMAYHNKAVVYGLLFKTAAETLLTIAADPKRLGARPGITAVLHTWGSALTHHPHLHCIVPGGGLSLDGQRWVACKPGFFLPVRVLSRLFRRLLLEQLSAAHNAGRLQFFGTLQHLADPKDFANHPWGKYMLRLRQLLSDDATPVTDGVDDQPATSTYTCQACGAPMIIIETFVKQMPRAPPVYS
jgi:hypothetical protein